MRPRKPNRKDVLKAYDRVMSAIDTLDNETQALGAVASDYTGVDLRADICNGNEIEFRIRDDNGEWDAFSCIRLDDIITDVP